MKARFRSLIPLSRAKEEADLVPFVNDDPPAEPGRWTAKDELSHLSAYREFGAAEINELRGGPAPRRTSDAVEVENQNIYARTHDVPAAEVMERARRSWDLLDAALERMTEEDLERDRKVGSGGKFSTLVANQANVHLAGHLVGWHQQRGDEAAVEGLWRWARDSVVEALPGTPVAGVGEYNMGCFYAARGRTEEALPYLKRGLELRPDLREFAQQDTDLDPIRSNPEVARLLA